MMPYLLVVIAVFSALWTFKDAVRRQNRNALIWAVAVFSFWIIVFPVYLWARRRAR